MIDFFYAIVLGIIQGLTEFWPISSSGHLVVAHDILQFDVAHDLAFDVALHLGTLLALLVYFWSDIRRYIVAWVRSLGNFQVRTDPEQRIAWLIVLGTIPAAVAGYFFDDIIESALRSVTLVASMLIAVGLLFFVFERTMRQQKTITDLQWPGALLVGVAQALALIPGVSRSGATILAGMGTGMTRAMAARFSFLLSIPIVAGAGAKQMIGLAEAGISRQDWLIMVAGFAAAAIVGYIAIRVLLKFLQNHSLDVFGWYRIGLGIVLFIYVFVR